MFTSLHGRSSYYRRSLLCLFFICILVVCTAYDKPELDKFSCLGTSNTSSISSSVNGFYEIFTHEFAGHSCVKSISSRNPVIRRFSGSKAASAYAVISNLFVFIGTCVLIRKYFYRTVLTSHRFIINYIHNLDGLKP